MSIFVCPKCKKELTISGGSYRCESGHCYDISREGYVNLLTADKKHSLEPGDNKIMVRARYDFLEKGYYKPLADELCATLKRIGAESVLDAGCGSGYYSRVIATALPDVRIGAIDVSKEAVRIGAKRGSAEYAVAGVYDIPAADGTFDAVLNVFSPHAFSEYARVLKESGSLIVVYPAPEHLIELKQVLYDEGTFENDKSIDSDLFESRDKRTVKYTVDVIGEDVGKLLAMTPYYYRTSPDKIAKASALEHITTTVAFCVETLTKRTL